MENNKDNPMVGIAAVCGGIMVPIAALVLIFASNQAWILVPVAGAMAVMGIFLGYFASKKG
ncbi:MAG: hypothetical protein ISS77_03515 [Phycisphaerae bacterium]|nr:hypothetical protein [Phycisphaerae bacterium]